MARLQARLNVGRLAATRLGDYYPSVWLYLNSLTAHRPGFAQGVMVKPSLTINESEGDVPATASFEIRDCTSPPQQGQFVFIGQGSADHRIFGGQIIDIEQTQSRYVEGPVFKVHCEDGHRLLNRRLVSVQFQSTDAGVILQTLVNSYTSSPFSITPSLSLGQVDQIEFTREQVSKAITRTVNRVGGRWRLDPYFRVRAWVGSEPGQPGANDLNATGKQESWRHTRDTSQVRTRIMVAGAETTTTTQNIAGTTLIFVSETAMLNGAATITIGRGFYNVASVSASESGSPFFIVLSNSLSAGGISQSPGGYSGDGATSSGARVQIVAIAQSTTLQNSIAAIEGGDGIHEFAIADGRMTQAGALQRAQAELTIYGSIEHRGEYTTRDPNAVAGRLVVANVASPTHITSVLARIQRVTVTDFEDSTRSWNTNRAHFFPHRRVTYSTAVVRETDEILGDFERSS